MTDFDTMTSTELETYITQRADALNVADWALVALRREITARRVTLSMPDPTVGIASVLATASDWRGIRKFTEALKATPIDPDPEMPEAVANATSRGTNRYANRCRLCGKTVAVGAGYYARDEHGKAHTYHKVGACQADTPVVCSVVAGGHYMVTLPDDTPRYVVMFDHPKYGLVGRMLQNDRMVKMTRARWHVERFGRPVEDCERQAFERKAVEVGLSTCACMFCGRSLERSTSQGVGYGPDCAAKYGLPHPDNHTAVSA